MPPLKETPAPPPGPLLANYWDGRGLIHGWRPRGTKDWLLLYTESGHCLARYEGGEFTAQAGDILLYQPGTPQDYGQHSPHGKWKNVWVHWVPRTEVLEWLNWPELSPGLRHLHLPVDLRRAVLKELILADSVQRSNTHRSDFLAANALERALLFCSRINSCEGDRRWNPRIQQAVEYLAKNLKEQHLLKSVAHRFGFSRARFAALFRRQVGQPPHQYLEVQRLSRARHLLAYTSQTLAEIADYTGFSSPFYLSLRFKKQYGHSPRTFRQQKFGA